MTPENTNMDPKNDGFPIGISFSSGRFSGENELFSFPGCFQILWFPRFAAFGVKILRPLYR